MRLMGERKVQREDVVSVELVSDHGRVVMRSKIRFKLSFVPTSLRLCWTLVGQVARPFYTLQGLLTLF